MLSIVRDKVAALTDPATLPADPLSALGAAGSAMAAALLNAGAPASISDLARAAGVPVATATRTATRLVALDLADETQAGRARMLSWKSDGAYSRAVADLVWITHGAARPPGESGRVQWWTYVGDADPLVAEPPTGPRPATYAAGPSAAVVRALMADLTRMEQDRARALVSLNQALTLWASPGDRALFDLVAPRGLGLRRALSTLGPAARGLPGGQAVAAQAWVASLYVLADEAVACWSLSAHIEDGRAGDGAWRMAARSHVALAQRITEMVESMAAHPCVDAWRAANPGPDGSPWPGPVCLPALRELTPGELTLADLVADALAGAPAPPGASGLAGLEAAVAAWRPPGPTPKVLRVSMGLLVRLPGSRARPRAVAGPAKLRYFIDGRLAEVDWVLAGPGDREVELHRGLRGKWSARLMADAREVICYSRAGQEGGAMERFAELTGAGCSRQGAVGWMALEQAICEGSTLGADVDSAGRSLPEVAADVVDALVARGVDPEAALERWGRPAGERALVAAVALAVLSGRALAPTSWTTVAR